LNLRQWLVPLLDEIVLDESVPAQIRRYVEQLIVLHKQRNTTSPQGGDEVPDALLALGVSKKEWRVLQHIIDGKSNDDIASTMFIAVSTVKTHINNLYKKLGVANRKEAIAKGQQLR